jgi:hypothetical protein
MDADRLERAARALLGIRDFEWSGHAEVDGHRGFFQACPACGGLRPDMAPRSLKNLHGHGKRCPLVALRAALAAQPAPNCLAPMTPEQRAAFKSLTGAEIDAALSEGKRNADAVRAASGGLPGAFSAPSPAQAGGDDTRCLFCRTELDLDEMDDGSDLPPLAPGVCSECFQRWHDEPVWRRRLKEATDKPAQAGEAVAWGDINARLRQHVEGIKDQGCANWGDPFSCDKQPNGTRSLRPCEPCLMGRLLERAAFDALFAPSRHGGAAQEQAGEAVGHVHDWDYDCRGSGPFCKLCGVGPSRPGGAA